VSPQLGQAVVAETDGKGPAFFVMEVDGARAACAVGIEFNTILSKADPIAATGVNLGIVWSTLRTTEAQGV
jgi:hypothetical protein